MERFSLVVCLLFGQALAGPWHFGQDNPNYDVLAILNGHIAPLVNITTVTIPMRPCTVLKYVWVSIQNPINQPSVSFNKEDFTVSIVYRPFSSSMSGYRILAKGKKMPRCYEQVDSQFKDLSNQLESSSNYSERLQQKGFYDFKTKAEIVKLVGKKKNLTRSKGQSYTEVLDAIFEVILADLSKSDGAINDSTKEDEYFEVDHDSVSRSEESLKIYLSHL